MVAFCWMLFVLVKMPVTSPEQHMNSLPSLQRPLRTSARRTLTRGRLSWRGGEHCCGSRCKQRRTLDLRRSVGRQRNGRESGQLESQVIRGIRSFEKIGSHEIRKA